MNELRFHSTRSASPVVSVGEALEAGLAPDGGLFIPETVPQVDFGALPDSSFQYCSKAYLSQWLQGTEFEKHVDALVDNALNFDVPLVEVEAGTFVLELFHGPTLSFKDFGARMMARMLGMRIASRGSSAIILVATSGDTGSAVADGFSGVPGIDVVLLYPKGGVSPIQEHQLIVKRPGVRALQVEGTFDDCQKLVKGAFDDSALEDLPLSTANSINVGRLIPQMLYYVWAVKVLQRNDVRVCVPSGNLGNLTASLWAHLSGMPVSGFIAAHNDNDFFPAYLCDPDAAFKTSVQTFSNAMDVGAPSNFERLAAMLDFGKMTSLIQGVSISNEETLESMQSVLNRTGYLADPHTAVGLEALSRFKPEMPKEQPALVVSTAHPAKFPETCEKTGMVAPVPEQLKRLAGMEEEVTTIAADAGAFRQVLLDLHQA